MWRIFLALFLISGCGGLAWNTTVANEPAVRRAMLDSLVVGVTTENAFMTRWGRPTQRIREGAETRLVYRDMTNPPNFYVPQFGTSNAYVVAVFQYGRAVDAYSNDTEGCRATFAPRPPGQAFDNPTTVHPVNCQGATTAAGSATGRANGGAPLSDLTDQRYGATGEGTSGAAGSDQSGTGRTGGGKL